MWQICGRGGLLLSNSRAWEGTYTVVQVLGMQEELSICETTTLRMNLPADASVLGESLDLWLAPIALFGVSMQCFECKHNAWRGEVEMF